MLFISLKRKKYIYQLKALVINILFCTFLTGCATLVNSSRQKIPVASNPSGARVEVDGISTCTTPSTLRLERNQDHILVFIKEGYQKETLKLLHVMSGAVFANLISWGIFGWAIDAMDGSQYKLVPDRVNVELIKVSDRASEEKKYLPKEEIIRIAILEYEKNGGFLKERNIIYDDGNKRWNEKYKSISVDMAPKYEFLKDKNYQAVSFYLKEGFLGGDVWYFIDKETGEVLAFYGEK